jgi:hypothetical protein
VKAPTSLFYFENWGDFGFLMSTQMRNHATARFNWPDLYRMSEYHTGANLLEGLNLGEFFNKRVYSYIPAVHDGSKYGYYDWIVKGADGVTMADFAMYPLDKVNPGASGWVAELVESGDEHETIYRIRLHSPNNEKLRPANREITYEDLATLQLDVAMVSDGQTYLIPAKAVNVDGKYIEYDFYGDVWPTLEGNVRITGIRGDEVSGG